MKSAKSRFLSTNTTRKNAAPENAVRFVGFKAAGFADVYDLEVAGLPEFFAGGILVHNSFRYGYKSFLENSRKPRAVEQQEVYDSYQDMTAKAMAMRRFEAQHPAQRRIGKPRAR